MKTFFQGNSKRALRHLVAFTLLTCSFVLWGLSASATHFRYGNIVMQPTGNPNQIQIKVSQAWRASFYGALPAVGATRSVGTLNFQYGTGAAIQNFNVNLTVTAVNAAEDWFFGEQTILVTAPNPNADYRAVFSVCCRISSLVNNRDLQATNIARLTLGNGNNAPVSTLPPIVNLPTGQAAAGFTIPAFDENGDVVSFRLATSAEFGGGTQPTGLSVNTSSGQVSWSTVGRPVGSLHNAIFMLDDGRGGVTPLDVIIRITNTSTPPLFDYAVTPANSSSFSTQPGVPVSFTVRAIDNDAGDVVSLQAIGVPVGATFSPVLPANGNPVQTVFTWTPTAAQLGSNVISFVAQDQVGVQTTTSVSINVSLRPSFDAPTPGAGSLFCLQPALGQSHAGLILASDPDPTDIVQITSVSGGPASFTLGASLPSIAGNPTTISYNFQPSASDWGQYTITATARDSYNEVSSRSWKYIVNDPPTFTSTPVTSVVAGTFYSYTVTTADLNIPQGDVVSFHHAHRPSWLNFTDNGNGTATLSGTPTIANAGMHPVEIHIEDLLNHIDGSHCGQAHQMFMIEVIPCNIQLSLSATDVLCAGATSGSVSVSLQNAVAPVQYSWSNGANTPQLTGVGAGTYTLSVLDANGCTANATVTVGEPAALVATVSANQYAGGWNVSCNGAADASIATQVQGGTAPYTYVWSNGAGTANLAGVAAGTYTVTITDANGCATSANITLQEPAALTMGATPTVFVGGANISCNGASDGSIILNAQGGTAPYTYTWSNGATTQLVSGLAAGTYSATVTDVNGCSVSSSVTLVEPAALSSSATAATYNGGWNISCNGAADGSASFSVQGGTAPYDYLWSNGATTASVSGLSAGTYTVVATDRNGCTTSGAVIISEPAALTSSASAQTYNGGFNISCNGAADGSIGLTVQGGTAPYTYAWSNGATTAAISGLSAGTYSVLATDANGCSISASVVLSEPSALTSSINAATFAGGWNVGCNGANNGSAQFAVQGGTAPYTYAWSNGANTASVSGLSAGTYTVVATDANGCSTSGSITLTEPSVFMTSISVTPGYTVQPGGNMHTIYLGYGAQSLTLQGLASGATAGYTYQWSPTTGLSSPNAATTSAAPTATTQYTLTVTDANGCISTATTTIFVVDARCGNNPRNPKVLVCKVPPGNPANRHEICVAPSAVAAHLATGSYVGPCNQAGSGARQAGVGFEVGKDMLVYPNPSPGLYFIELQPEEAVTVRIEVYDAQGKLVLKQQVPFGGSLEQHELDLQHVSPGVYHLRVQYAQQMRHARLVKN